jgi:signal transduction histidine kinase/DNA-binding response OmpR family regulator
MSDQDLTRELAYYKRQLDELAAARVSTEHRQWVLQAQLRQRTQGFALLSRLAQAVGGQTDLGVMLRVSALEINGMLGMDRTCILVPAPHGEAPGTFVPAYFAGLSEAEAEALSQRRVALPGLATSRDLLLAWQASERTPLCDALRGLFALSTFVCVPVQGQDAPLAVIVSGRLVESAVYSPALDEGDADTFRAIAGVLAAAVQNVRLGMLEQSQRLKSEFFANASHELRTPLTIALGPLSQVLSGRWGKLPEPVRERLEVVERNQKRLLSHVNEILELARLNAGAAELSVAPIGCFNALVEECAQHFRAAAELRGIELGFDLDPALEGLPLLADKPKLERVLFNLLSNALKFTDGGRVDVTTRRAGGLLELVVTDTGIGLSPDELPGLFQRFARIESKGAAPRAGTGIGLSLVKEIAALHGGSVTVESARGRGSRFAVTLPLHRAEHGAAPQPAPSSARGSDVGRALAPLRDDVAEHNRTAEAEFDAMKPVALCIDDDADLRAYLRDVLAADYNVFVAADGADGLTRARRYLPDVIVCDQIMPRMSGLDLLRALHAEPELATIPFIFLTAHRERDSRIDRLIEGADDYLTKPFDEFELRARALNLVRSRARERELGRANRRLELRVREQMAELVNSGEIKRFLPRAVLDTLSRGALEPGRTADERHVTVLVVEVSGWAAGGVQLARLGSTLDEYLGSAAAIAATHGGTIDSLAGGRVSIVFGAPEASRPEQSAWAAVQAAFELHRKLLELGAAARRRGLPSAFKSRAAIAAGSCLVGALGGDTLRAYTAVGAAVDEAFALLGLASPGGIAASRELAQLLGNKVRTSPLRARSAGFESPGVELFDLLEPVPSERPLPLTISSTPPPPSSGRMLRREGDYWTIAYGGALFRLRDAKGLEYLARLLERPGSELHVLDLVSWPSASDGSEASLSVVSDSDAGPVLDGAAKSAYRTRLRELDEELAEATRAGDAQRAARAQEEIHALASQLAQAVGLGGRDRRAASASERARINVTRALKAVVDKVASSHPDLARHLRAALKTGVFCSYSPQPGVPDAWTVGRDESVLP